MEDITHGTGAIKDTPDSRDYQFGEEIGHAATPFDWEKGYDCEQEVSEAIGKPYKLKIKDQNGSSSCGGQAWSYYGEILDALNDKEAQEKSAKFIYAQTAAPGGGSAGRTNCELVKSQGWGNEEDCSSYEDGKPPSEAFMTNIGAITAFARERAKKDRAVAYANVAVDMDTIAQAVRDNHGCIFGITGQNNGTWRTEFPKPALSYDKSWNHWIYIGKAKIIKGVKHFGLAQSWGESVGNKGWQWLSESHVMALINGHPIIWSIWTMIARKDEEPIPDFRHHFVASLKQGIEHPEVKMLQTALKIEGVFPENVNTTNFFGSITLAAVKTFQRKYGLVVDGRVGDKTNKKLNDIFDK